MRWSWPSQMPKKIPLGIIVLLSVVSIGGMLLRDDWWLTHDQQGDRHFRAKRFAEAAALYDDPMRKGVALYRAGEYKEAAAIFAHVGTPEANFDRGNAFVMLGKYDEAITSYDRALAQRPGWLEAQENRNLAQVRRDRVKKVGGEMTEGKLAPDEIVFEKGAKKQEGDPVEIAGGDPLTDDQLRALWLRRVQTRPADFLRAKFSYQVQDQESQGAQP